MTFFEELKKLLKSSGWVGLKPLEAVELVQDILHSYADYLEKNEPYAINTINMLRETAESLPEEDE